MHTKTAPAKLLPAHTATHVHAMVTRHLNGRALTVETARLDDWSMVPHADPLTYGGQIVEATGRATCRCCGEKIRKGTRAIRFEYSFTESGGYTTTPLQMHATPCPPAGA